MIASFKIFKKDTYKSIKYCNISISLQIDVSQLIPQLHWGDNFSYVLLQETSLRVHFDHIPDFFRIDLLEVALLGHELEVYEHFTDLLGTF